LTELLYKCSIYVIYLVRYLFLNEVELERIEAKENQINILACQGMLQRYLEFDNVRVIVFNQRDGFIISLSFSTVM